MTDEELLALVDTAIAKILGGGAVKSWREGSYQGSHQVEHLSLAELYAFKQEIENRIAQAGSPMVIPIREINQ